MRHQLSCSVLEIIGMAAITLVAALTEAQSGPVSQKPVMAEEVFKNVQVLRGIPVDEFMNTMGFFSASLGANCTTCHGEESGGSWEKYADDTDYKRTTRRMILMVNGINKTNFAGSPLVTCYSCHRGDDRPKVRPSLLDVYGAPPPEDPNEAPLEQAAKGVSAAQIMDKYIQALGGEQRLAAVTSFIGKGTQEGYADPEKHPLELFAKAPNQRATIIHTRDGDNTAVFDGQAGWVAQPTSAAPVPVLALTGANLEGSRWDAELSFPAQLRQAVIRWTVGSREKIDDHSVQVLEGLSAGKVSMRLFFDENSGLLVRFVRFSDSPVGSSPTQIDYSDYREVSGIKMPFHWTVTWLDGRSIVSLIDVQLNTTINPARFAKPAAPKAPTK
jgi:outer membrane lipoprotein-sorting protein